MAEEASQDFMDDKVSATSQTRPENQLFLKVEASQLTESL